MALLMLVLGTLSFTYMNIDIFPAINLPVVMMVWNYPGHQLPVKVASGTPVLLGHVAPVSDTHQPQENVVRINRRDATYLLVIKQAAASTLSVVDAVKSKIPGILAVAPKGLKTELAFDQFVRAALWYVLQEALTAAILVALMVLIFVGSARSMLIVITSIPLSILNSIIVLNLAGQTINTMTLGGLALAVGTLVDAATVEVENIHRNHTPGKSLIVAILDGASQIATPTLVGTLSICVVFFPVVLLRGVARYLFPPLALAVVAAMLTSYLLSRTLVPAMASYLLPEYSVEAPPAGLAGCFLQRFEHGFERLRETYAHALSRFIAHRGIALIGVAVKIAGSLRLMWGCGPGLLPQPGFRTYAASRPRTNRDPYRSDGMANQPDRSRHPARNSCERAPKHQRQYRGSAVLHSCLLPNRQHWRAGYRHLDRACTDTSAIC
jgi:multidrug efflux pump subunit AcrB